MGTRHLQSGIALVLALSALVLLPLAVRGSGKAADAPKCFGEKSTIVGSSKSDDLKGTAKADVIFARGGGDTIRGRGGNDLICGKGGSDEIKGGSGDDSIAGGGGDDELNGGTGDDRCSGGPGKDTEKNCEGSTTGQPPGGGEPPPPPPPSNQAPTDLSLSNADVNENLPSGTPVGALSTTDPNATDTHTYSLVAGTGSEDNASFQIDGSNVETNAIFDFEADSSYSIRVRTTDAGGLTFEKQFTITITDEVETGPPTNINLSNASVAENQPSSTTVGTLSATDPDVGDTHTFSLVAGTGDADNASFQISGSSLQTNAVFNFEADSSYSIRVRTTDSNNDTFEKQFTITVTNANDAPTNINLSNASVAENQPANTTVGNLSATDPDAGATHTFSLVAGTGDTDNASFNILGGALRTSAVLNFEAKSSYSIRVRTDDGQGGTFEKQLTITVTNVNEAPTDLSLSNASVAENQPVNTTVGNLSATDADAGATHTFTLVAGTGDTDNASFNISGGALRTSAIFNFEAKSSYSVRVRGTDNGGLIFEKQLTITVTNANEAPTNINLSNASVAENQPSNTAVGNLSATDVDAGATHTFTLVAGTGDADNASFQISGSSLRTNAVFNFEADSSYSIRVRGTDNGGLFFEKQFTITITNVNDAPTTANDSYSGAIGNTLASRGVAVSGEPVVALTGNLLTQNDTDQDGDTVTAVPETVSTTGGGLAEMRANGSFTYLPGVGDKNQTDSFTYRVTDGTLQSTGTATVGITNELVWYVDRDAPSNGDGRSTMPLQNLAGINGAGGSGDADGTSDRIFLYSSATNYTGGLPLETSQRLVGEPEGLIVSAITLVPAAGTNPTITNSGGAGITLAGSVVIRHVNVSGTSGAGITGGAVSGIDAGSMTISNPGSDGVFLNGTDNVSFQSTTITGANNAGVDGTGVSGFTFINGAITNAGDTKTSTADAAFAFNSAAANNVDGAVTITGNTVTNPYGGGIAVSNTAGTISDAQISNNQITSATNMTDSKGDGINLTLKGTASTVASLTKGTIQNNTIQNFPSGRALRFNGGNETNSATAAAGTYGTPDSGTNLVTITGNTIQGDATNKFSGEAMVAAVAGRGTGNFAITNNGTVANPVVNSLGAGIGAIAAGNSDVDFLITGNVLAPNNENNSSGISVSTDRMDLSTGNLRDPDLDAIVSNNTISNSQGGIRVLQGNSNGSIDLRLQNNTISGLTGVGAGGTAISVENGTSPDAAFNPTMCAQISGNPAPTSGPADDFGDRWPGIYLSKDSTSSSTYVFGIVGLSPSPATNAQTEAYVTSLNPTSSLGAGFYAGKRVVVNVGDNFTSCTLPF